MPTCADRAMPAVTGLFPDGVIAGAVPVASAGAGPRTVLRAAADRQAEFAAGRMLAAELLARMSCPETSVGIGPRGAPEWPAGVVGSISHARGACVAAIARAQAIGALGLDVEPDEPVEPDLWPSILTPMELEGTAGGDADAVGRRVRLTFSAKEAVFKAQFPATGADLEFGQVSIRWGRGEFMAVFSDVPRDVARLGKRLRGGFRVADGWIVTAAWVKGTA